MEVLDINHREKDQEKNGGSEDIHPDGVQVTGPPAPDILFGQKPGFCKKILNRCEKLAVKMSNI